MALVLECARANGDIVSSRKGILDVRLQVTGRAAHAGVEPEKGRSAILEAARIVEDLHALNGRWPGVTVNVGVIGGGTRPERRARAVHARGRRSRDVTRGARGRRGGDAPRRRGDRGRRHDGRVRADGSLVAHGEARAQRPARRSCPGHRRVHSASRSTTRRPVAHRTPTPRRGWESRASMGSARSVATTIRPAEYLDVDSIVPRTTLLAGAAARRRRRSGGHPLAGEPRLTRRLVSSGGPWEAHRGLQPRRRDRGHVLGRRHDRRRTRWPIAATRATSGAQTRAVFEIIERRSSRPALP